MALDGICKPGCTAVEPHHRCRVPAAVTRAANEDATGNRKPTNPKDAVGSRKARWFSYIPVRVMVGVGLALLEGARKYGRHNYRIAGVRASVYLDACVCGHLTPWAEGEDIDPDSGLNHIDKAIATLMVLRDSMLEGNWTDDRAPACKDWTAFMANAHKMAAAIIDRYPEAKAPFTIADTIRAPETAKPKKPSCVVVFHSPDNHNVRDQISVALGQVKAPIQLILVSSATGYWQTDSVPVEDVVWVDLSDGDTNCTGQGIRQTFQGRYGDPVSLADVLQKVSA